MKVPTIQMQITNLTEHSRNVKSLGGTFRARSVVNDESGEMQRWRKILLMQLFEEICQTH
jgi:hypothetical protein